MSAGERRAVGESDTSVLATKQRERCVCGSVSTFMHAPERVRARGCAMRGDSGERIPQQRRHQHPAHPTPGLALAAPGPHGLAAVRRAPHVIIASAMSACADRLPRAHAASSWFSSVFTSPTITVSALASTSSCAYSSEATTSIVATAALALSFARATR